jgi:hypothetical protein
MGMRVLCRAGVLLLAALPAQAGVGYWTYRDWQVKAELVRTGEEQRVTCTAMTGGNGAPVLSVSLSNGDAGPPYAFPLVVLEEQAPRHTPTQMQTIAPIAVVFDGGEIAALDVRTYFDDDGLARAMARNPAADSQWLLQTMQRSSEMSMSFGDETVLDASLSGFSAAYLKMAEECGFSGAGVVH